MTSAPSTTSSSSSQAGASNFTGEMAAELLALVDSGTIRVIDILILTKDENGAVDAMLADVGELGELQAIEAQLAELLAANDVEHRYGAGEHRRGAHLGEPVGCAIRVGGAPCGWPTDRQWTDSYSSNHCLHRGR